MKKKLQFLFQVACIILCFIHQASSLEASFTPAPDKDTGSTDGPLPLSQNQRNQLLQLDQQIAQSQNPQETLKKVAESNGMSVDELGSLLMRNRRDMQMASGGGSGVGGGVSNSLPRKMIRLLSTIFLIGFKSASARPRTATIMGLLLISTLYVILSAPRTGIVLSYGNGLVSKGHTTFLPPPTKYLSRHVNRISLKSSLPQSVKPGSLSRLFSEEDEQKMKGHIKKLSKSEKKKLTLVANAQKEIPFGVLLPSEEELELMHENETDQVSEGDSKEEIMEKIETRAWEHAIDLAFTSACKILNKRRYSEFIPSPSNRLRMYSETRKDDNIHDVSALVMKSLGDWGRFGIQPLRLISENETDDCKSIVYNTLKGGLFDGELQISVRRRDDQDEEEQGSSVVVSVTLSIPRKGRRIKDKIAIKMLSLLAESIAISSITEAKQILSRELQCSIYRGRAKTRAAEKRHIAYENMKKMEEMAEERRRKWQRNNPDAGRYRPSGHMMRGPGGGPSYGY
jgi:hypothetical protein